MKFNFLQFFLLLITLFIYVKTTQFNQVLLSNHEIREILKCFGDLDLEEGCVICRYVTQKIYKVLDISAMCPDIVETKLLAQRQREWQPDPQVINKWTVLYNLQKDYMERMKPKIEGMKNYDKIISEKLQKEKVERGNLSNLIQFQNKVNLDLKKKSEGDNKFDKDEDCEDEDQSYNHNKITAAEKNSGHLSDFNKTLMKKFKDESQNKKKNFTPSHKNKLQESMQSFFKKSSNQGDSEINSSEMNSEADSNLKQNSSDSSSLFNSKINFKINPSLNPSNSISISNSDFLPLSSPVTHVVHQAIPQPITLPSLQVTPSPDELINLNVVHQPPVIYSQVVGDPLKSFADMGKKILEMDSDDKDKQDKSEKPKEEKESDEKKEEKKKNNKKEKDEKIKKDKNIIAINPYQDSDISESSTTNRKISIEATIKNPGKNANQIKSIINQTIKDLPATVTKIDTVIDENKNKSNLSKLIKSNSLSKEDEKSYQSSKKSAEIKPPVASKSNNETINTTISKEVKPKVEINSEKQNIQQNPIKPMLSGKIQSPQIEIESFLQKSETNASHKDEITKLSSKLEESKNSIFDDVAPIEEVLDPEEDPMDKLNEKILNPPPMASFLETSEFIHFNKDLFESLIAKSSNFNLETQRRGRRRSRFPDPQWDCAESQISKLVMYLCEEEISASYQKYCKPIFEQINTMVESFLYHDNNLEICQNLHMCPVTMDIK